jgi:peptide/nickel transport system substrate-binding protein|tara:strand:+ start:1077 stop:3551 length:2475 start_codon:yes stop_codon:yes gene_type:complete
MKQLKKIKIFLACSLLFSVFPCAFAEKGTFLDEIRFVQYLDENTALEEVRNGKLDLYYYRVSSDRLKDSDSRDGLQVFESTGGYFSILTNPTDAGDFNPFSIREVRYALNFLVDRNLIVNELLGGYGSPMISNYGSFSADYLGIIDVLESFQFRYNPSLANQIIIENLEEKGAYKSNGVWHYEDKPIEITFFIRSDDPARKAIGEILSSKLESIGFVVKKEFGDLNKAFVLVYGSNPAEQKWHLYTEGWGSSGFSRYDSVALAQMYSPWFSNMPGNNNPSYWNYHNESLDDITQKIYSSEFTTSQERISLIKEATKEGVNESVRIFLASKVDQYVANENVDGVINALGAGVPSRFTPINIQTADDTLTVGVKQIYQGSWNPVAGLTDTYSTQIWFTLFDPSLTGHPFSGEALPIRTNWQVETNGPDLVVSVPSDAIIWDTQSKKWTEVGPETFATSKVTFDLKLGKWHNGQNMDMNDVIYSMYFLLEWGSEKDEADKTFDSDYSPQAAQNAETLVGIRPINDHTIEVYTNYWHFDQGEIASWSSPWSSMPWEIMASMEKIVTDGKSSFSRSESISKNVNWLSLIIPNDARMVQDQLQNFKSSEHIPDALSQFEQFPNSYSRYQSSIDWIEKYEHAVISNGPFYLEGYSPDSRTIIIKSFDSEGYPLMQGEWQTFENAKFPFIESVELDELVEKDTKLSVPVKTKNASEIHYFLSDSEGQIIRSGILPVSEDFSTIILESSDVKSLPLDPITLKIFAASDDVLRPYEFSTSFLVTESNSLLPESTVSNNLSSVKSDDDPTLIVIVVLSIIGIAMFALKRKMTKKS